jgi:hypothetical protein
VLVEAADDGSDFSHDPSGRGFEPTRPQRLNSETAAFADLGFAASVERLVSVGPVRHGVIRGAN